MHPCWREKTCWLAALSPCSSHTLSSSVGATTATHTQLRLRDCSVVRGSGGAVRAGAALARPRARHTQAKKHRSRRQSHTIAHTTAAMPLAWERCTRRHLCRWRGRVLTQAARAHTGHSAAVCSLRARAHRQTAHSQATPVRRASAREYIARAPCARARALTARSSAAAGRRTARSGTARSARPKVEP